jgi:DtxR family transcriptional regulator, manganese transport regulator
MPKATSPSSQHQKTRHDHTTEHAEDYAEAVAELTSRNGHCRLKDLAIFFGVSHVTAHRVVARLVREGILTTIPYRPIELTAEGKKLALQSKQRHEIVLQFLLKLGLDTKTAAIDAEGIEHHVSPKTLKVFEKFVRGT